MEINIERIRNRFDNKIRRDEVVKVYKDFKKIDDVLKSGIEESIVSFFKGKLNIELCKREIENRKLEIKKLKWILIGDRVFIFFTLPILKSIGWMIPWLSNMQDDPKKNPSRSTNQIHVEKLKAKL